MGMDMLTDEPAMVRALPVWYTSGMDLPRIDHTVTEQDAEAIDGHFEAILAALPFLIGLDPLERKRLIKAGENAWPFLQKCLATAQRIEDHLPRSFEVDGLSRQLALMDRLRRVEVRAEQLVKLVQDTQAVLTTQAYDESLEVYRTAKRVSGAEGLEDIVADLGRRFQRPRRNKDSSDS